MFMFITSVLKCIEVILFCGCSFCAYRSWLTLMHVLHLSMPTVHLNAFRRRRWHECHCPSCLIKYAGNAGRRGLHAQGRHLHPSLERGSLNTLLVLRALEFFVLQSLSGFCVFVCTESKASMYHGVGQPNFGPKLGGDFMVENSTGENQDRRTGTGPWQSAEMSDSTRGLVPCDPNFSKYASLQSDVAQLKMHRSTIGFNMFQYVSICFNMFQYVSICFNTVQACGHAHFIGVLSTSCVLHTGLSTQGSGNTTPCPTTWHSFSLLKLTPQPQASTYLDDWTIYFNQQSSILWADLHTLHHCHHEMIEMISYSLMWPGSLNWPRSPTFHSFPERCFIRAWREKLYCRVISNDRE